MSKSEDLEDAPLSYKSGVWEHFGFPKVTGDGESRVDRTREATSSRSDVFAVKCRPFL